MTFDAHIARELGELERAHLLRSPRTVHGRQGAEILIDGRRVLGFCSNNYLGLADDQRLIDAAAAALASAGLGAGASRHISGSSDLHREAEARLASFVKQPAALLFSSGYAANLGAIQALMGESDVIFSDALNHASLIDGCRLSRATTRVYRHADPEHLRDLLRTHRARHRNALVLSESLFSMDGDEAPLAELRQLADAHGAGLMLDEAHALGVFGPAGRGLAHALGVTPDLLVGTLGKAFGSAGAFVAGPEASVRLVQNRARSFVFSTAPPAMLAAAAVTATTLVEQADGARARVLAHAGRLRSELARLGYRVSPGRSPIVPVHVGRPDAAMALSHALLERGAFVHGIRPPTVPAGTSRLRITPIASHSEAHLTRLLDALAELAELAEPGELADGASIS